MPNSSPYYPGKPLSYGSIFFFIRNKTYNIPPFDKASILEARRLTLKEARDASPNYKMFLTAAKMATGLSERTIKTILYEKEIK